MLSGKAGDPCYLSGAQVKYLRNETGNCSPSVAPCSGSAVDIIITVDSNCTTPNSGAQGNRDYDEVEIDRHKKTITYQCIENPSGACVKENPIYSPTSTPVSGKYKRCQATGGTCFCTDNAPE